MSPSATAAPTIPAPLPEGGAGGGFLHRDTHTDHRTTAAAQFIDFHPTKEAASDILCAIADPDQTLDDIARRFHTTLDALADWLDSPHVVQRIEKMKRVAANRDELILAVHQRTAIAVLLSILEGHQYDEQHIPVDSQNLKSVTQRDRRRAAARLAASQFIRLSGPGGTDVSSVLSARRSLDRRPPSERTRRSAQAGRLCHTDHQTLRPPNPGSSPAHPLTSSPPSSATPQPSQSFSESLNRRTPDFPCPRLGATMSAPSLSTAERDALGAIALLAAFADGSPDDAERERMHAAIEAEEGISNEIYQRVIFKRTDAAREAAALVTPESKRAAFDLAVAVCDSDGATNSAEKAFLTSLASTLGIAAEEAKKTIEQVDLLAESPVSVPVPAQALAAPAAVIAAVAPVSDPRQQQVESTITNHAVLCGALELLPQTLATAAIIPVQMKMVYSIGKQHGFNLDSGHIKDFLATIGVGMTSQVVEGAARRIMGNLLESVAGRLVDKGLAGTIGNYGQKATGGAITFASTYALGQVARQYYAGGRKLSAIDLKTLFTSQTESAKQMYEKYKPAIEQQAQKLNPAQLLSLVRG